MAVPRIQCVCGFGCGSSMMLKMAIDDILKKHNLEAETFTGDVSTCTANPCDAIFISRELGERVQDHAEVPVIIINNFLDNKEVEQKTLDYVNSFSK